MKQILKSIFEKAIKNEELDLNENQLQTNWLGFPPLEEIEINKKETQLGLKFPHDYKQFLKICNGHSEISSVDPTFLKINDVDFFRNYSPETIKTWKSGDLKEIGIKLERSILIGGKYEDQYFLLIPPLHESNKWEYWKFAFWIPGEEPYKSLINYFENILEFMNEEM